MLRLREEKEAELENFALTVASDLPLNGPQAYFHETLLESGLGSGFAPGTGYSSSRRETSSAVALSILPIKINSALSARTSSGKLSPRSRARA